MTVAFVDMASRWAVEPASGHTHSSLCCTCMHHQRTGMRLTTACVLLAVAHGVTSRLLSLTSYLRGSDSFVFIFCKCASVPGYRSNSGIGSAL